MCDPEAVIKLVRVELVGREDAEGLGVALDEFGEVGSDTACQRAISVAKDLRFHV